MTPYFTPENDIHIFFIFGPISNCCLHFYKDVSNKINNILLGKSRKKRLLLPISVW